MQLLLGPGAPRPLGDDNLRELYRWPPEGLVRANMVSTLDGSAVGADGVSGSINTPADHRVFAALRDGADAVVVGAGTARAEGYGPPDPTAYRPHPARLVVVSTSGWAPPGAIAATVTASGRNESEDVWIIGEEQVDLEALLERLRESGMPRILTEGGPGLLTDFLTAGLVDELALTLAPRLVGGHGKTLTTEPLPELGATPRLLLEEDGSLMTLWSLHPAQTR